MKNQLTEAFVDCEVGTQQIGNYKIKIDFDFDALNPFEDWDCNPTLITFSARNLTTYIATCDKGFDIASIGHILPPYRLQQKPIRKHLAALMDMEYQKFMEAVCDHKSDYGLHTVNDAVLDYVWRNFTPSNYYSTNKEVFQSLEHLFNLIKGHKAYYFEKSKFPLGLIVVTPQFLEASGLNMKQIDEKFFKSTQELYAAWLCGDVYGFEVETLQGEFVDSCYGFYGSDHSKSGLFEAVNEAISAREALNYQR